MKIYLAGPDVFLPDAVEIGRRKVEICARHGLTGLYPLDNAVDLRPSDASLRIFSGNEAMMDRGRRHHRQSDAVSRPGRRCRHRLRTRLYGRTRQALPRLFQRSLVLCRPGARIHRRDVARWPPGRRAGTDRRGFRPDRQSDDDPRARSARLRAGDATADARGYLARPDRVRDLRAHGRGAAARPLRAHRVDLGEPRPQHAPSPQARGPAAGRARPVREPGAGAGRDRGRPRHRQRQAGA